MLIAAVGGGAVVAVAAVGRITQLRLKLRRNDATMWSATERAERAGATTVEVDSSHVPMISHPGAVLDVIQAAAR